MNQKGKAALILFSTTISATATAGAQRSRVSVVSNGVTIVDTRTGALKPNQAIVIDAGKIVKIANAGSVATSGTAKVVDVRGEYGFRQKTDNRAC